MNATENCTVTREMIAEHYMICQDGTKPWSTQEGIMLQTARETRGLTAKDIASCANIVPRTLRKWELGQNCPSPDALTTVLRAIFSHQPLTKEDILEREKEAYEATEGVVTRINNIKGKHRLTNCQLGALIGCSSSTVSDYVTRTRRANQNTIEKLKKLENEKTQIIREQLASMEHIEGLPYGLKSVNELYTKYNVTGRTLSYETGISVDRIHMYVADGQNIPHNHKQLIIQFCHNHEQKHHENNNREIHDTKRTKTGTSEHLCSTIATALNGLNNDGLMNVIKYVTDISLIPKYRK